MHPFLFIPLLAASSLAMVYATVHVSRARLRHRNPGGWTAAYALSWAAIIIVVVLYLRGEGAVEPSLPLIIAFPVGWLALHALMLRFAERTMPTAESNIDLADVLPPPAMQVKLVRFVKLMLSAVIALVIIAIGQNIELLHRIDTELAPHRQRVITALIVLVAAGFALFMGGIIKFVLSGGRSGTLENAPFAVLAGVPLFGVSLLALFVVISPPGVKLVVILALAYAAARVVISMFRRTPRISTDPR